AIRDPDARAEGLRRVTRKLIEKGQAESVEGLAGQMSDGLGPLAVVGLEFQRAGQADRAKKLLEQILAQLQAAKPKPNKPMPLPLKLTPDVVAFVVAKGRANELPKPVKPEEKDIDQVGHAIGTAWQGKHGDARAAALKAGTAVLKLEALAAIAD